MNGRRAMMLCCSANAASSPASIMRVWAKGVEVLDSIDLGTRKLPTKPQA